MFSILMQQSHETRVYYIEIFKVSIEVKLKIFHPGHISIQYHCQIQILYVDLPHFKVSTEFYSRAVAGEDLPNYLFWRFMYTPLSVIERTTHDTIFIHLKCHQYNTALRNRINVLTLELWLPHFNYKYDQLLKFETLRFRKYVFLRF